MPPGAGRDAMWEREGRGKGAEGGGRDAGLEAGWEGTRACGASRGTQHTHMGNSDTS